MSFELSATYSDGSLQSRHVVRQPRAGILRGPVGRFGFDGWRGLSGCMGAAVGTRPVGKQVTNQGLLVAFPVLGGDDLQTDDGGVHGMAEHFLGSGTEGEGEGGKRKRSYLVHLKRLWREIIQSVRHIYQRFTAETNGAINHNYALCLVISLRRAGSFAERDITQLQGNNIIG